ncbi:MAG: hypothetical protein JWN70_5579 [Planctomycetaceae bacterium]|nr:hypothetical protein [Planctomycetaceae bacterium]
MPRCSLVVLLFVLAWTLPVRGDEVPSVEDLLRDALDSSNTERQNQAILKFVERQPEARIVRAMALLVTRDSPDFNVYQHAEYVITTQLEKEPLLTAPAELIAGLNAPHEIRRRTLSTLKSFRRFDAADLPELLEQIRQHDDIFVYLASTFSDLPRLKKLAAESTVEVRSMALYHLWRATHDLNLCLPLYLESVHEQLPLEVAQRVNRLELQIADVDDLIRSLPEKSPQREKLAQQRQSLLDGPLIRQKVHYNLAILARMTKTHELTFDYPEPCGKILAAMISDEKVAASRRTLAAKVLTTIARTDNHDRQSLVDLGIAKQVATCQTTVTDDTLRMALEVCVRTLNTVHSRAKASSAAEQLKEKDDTKDGDTP